ncbi:MAG: hypothetical protein C0467_28725 [Planctomycetaceae bacterium]|nr:hypothetical protein [Planctomycetaceae bacterium]
MLTRGNHKLGTHQIWSFSLPSGTTETCPGMTQTCGQHCYAVAMERYRPAAVAKYRRNLAISRRRDFATRLRAFLIAHAIRVVRIHVGGDFYSPKYAKLWLRIIRRSPRTHFFFYSRAWRIPAIKTVLDCMADLRNTRIWYSLDRDTGVPTEIPARVRLAWLMGDATDLPPPGTDLVFRVRRLRRLPFPSGMPTVCPTEDGQLRTVRVTCERCGFCWRPLALTRTPLPVIESVPPRRCP